MHHLAPCFFALAAAALVAGCGPSADALVSKGIERAIAGETEAALATFERALERDDEHPAALYNAGLAELLLGRPERALEHLRRLAELHPDDARTLHLLARAFVLLDRREEAIGALQRSVEAGFDEIEAIEDGIFAPLRTDLRFLQIASLVAQRSGRGQVVDERGRVVLGGAVVNALQIPGQGPAACGAPDDAGRMGP